MKKTIKIIDLLNKRANGDVLPIKIKYDYIWIYEEADDDYYSNSLNVYLFEEYLKECIFKYLNDEVEILDEEEFEDIEEIEYYESCRDGMILVKKINKLIKNQKKIIERLKSDK